MDNKSRHINKLQKMNDILTKENKQLKKEIKIFKQKAVCLEEKEEKIKVLELKISKLLKNSSTSSKRPSSDDITKANVKLEGSLVIKNINVIYFLKKK